MMTPDSPGRAVTGSISPLTGRVAGAVLAAIRRQAGQTQEQLAEGLGVSATTVQAWEQGRKPLINVPFARLSALRARLCSAGADAGLLWLWERALHADAILAGLSVPVAEGHPLTATVPDRTMTELLAWPISGVPPRELAGTGASIAAGTGELKETAAVLREAAERAGADDETTAMLRRQATFLLAQEPGSRQQAADLERRDLQNLPGFSQWTPRWPVARSAAIGAASAGDPQPLHDFIGTGLAADELISANLNYWAYWAGEHAPPWSADRQMTQTDVHGWAGRKLLETLLDGVVNAPYRDLCAVTLWALLRSHRMLAVDRTLHDRIGDAVSAVLDEGGMVPATRSKLEQVRYLVRSE
jgi:DNA-binding XRE family transcriptional regulator